MWAKIDDGYLTNPKIMQLDPAAKLLHIASILYCCRELTDGAFGRQTVPMLAAMAGLDGDITPFVTALLTLDLWSYDGVTYRVHDFLEYNPGAAAIKAKREATKVRQERWRQNHAETRPKPAAPLLPDDTPRQVRNGVTDGVRNGVINAAPVPVPVPLSTPTDVGVESAPKAKPEPKARAQRLPVDWTPGERELTWAAQAGYDTRFVTAETDKFRDHFTANGKPQVDWPAAWRNWLRRSADFAPKVTPIRANGHAGRDIGYSNEDLERIMLTGELP